jgi:nucleoside-diphosphate-sugar epimerase
MRIFMAGATGTLGRPVVRALVSRGHTVVGLARSGASRRTIESMGAEAVSGDALDADRLRTIVKASHPDQVLHLLTALPAAGALTARQLRPTNRVRTRGTENLLRAAIEAGARRIVAESFIAVYGVREAARPLTEDEALPGVPQGALREAVLAMRSLEAQLDGARVARRIESVALRIGYLYGSEVPATQALIRQARAGRLFAPRTADGLGPFVHLTDAASAIVSAVETPVVSPIYNIADDRPFGLVAFLSELARAIAAAPPRPLPDWLIRIAAPLVAELASARLRVSNHKAKRELHWTLRYPTVPEGMAEIGTALSAAA